MVPRSNPKETVLVITTGFLVLGLLLHRPVLLDVALVVGIAGVLSGYLSRKIDWCWTKLSVALSFVSNTVLLTLVFILVLTPVGLLRRLSRKNRMAWFDAARTSNFIERDHTFQKGDLEQTW